MDVVALVFFHRLPSAGIPSSSLSMAGHSVCRSEQASFLSSQAILPAWLAASLFYKYALSSFQSPDVRTDLPFTFELDPG